MPAWPHIASAITIARQIAAHIVGFEKPVASVTNHSIEAPASIACTHDQPISTIAPSRVLAAIQPIGSPMLTPGMKSVPVTSVVTTRLAASQMSSTRPVR